MASAEHRHAACHVALHQCLCRCFVWCAAARGPADRPAVHFEEGGGQKEISPRRRNAPAEISGYVITCVDYGIIKYVGLLCAARYGTVAPANGQTAMDTAAGLISEMSAAPTMGKLAKLRYTHDDMIDFIIGHPGISQNDLAARYGYTPAWISNVMASDAWKAKMAARREEMVDPTLAATINERFAALADRSLTRLMEKLDAPAVSDNVVLKAVELGAKALGVGGNAPPPAPAADHLAQLANRLIDLQANVRKGVILEGQAVVVEDGA